MATMLPPGVSWEQTDEDLEVRVELGGGEVKRSDVAVRTTAVTLQVWQKFGADWRPLLVGTLRRAVEASSCCWSIERGAIVVQLEKAEPGSAWDVLLKADPGGSILEECGRDQVIADADGDASSVTCGRCGELVARKRWEAHETLWCPALGDAGEDDASETCGASEGARAAAYGLASALDHVGAAAPAGGARLDTPPPGGQVV